jgi:hypothetical protein
MSVIRKTCNRDPSPYRELAFTQTRLSTFDDSSKHENGWSQTHSPSIGVP